MLIKTIRFKRYTKLSKQQVLQFTQLKTCTLRKKFTVEKNNYVQYQGDEGVISWGGQNFASNTKIPKNVEKCLNF